jgi:hypothetical protein
MIDWEIHGMEFVNCNCNYGCPCQFNALPTHGDCHAVAFFRVDTGHFGLVPLGGLSMAFAVTWPGAVHQGHGSMQPFIDERADDAQRAALLSIMTGKETDPMATFFAVFTAMSETVKAPIHTRITVELDMDQRRATCEAAGSASGRGEPILNPVTKQPHRAGILMPNGFEYGQAEVGRGWSNSMGAVVLTLNDSHAHWAELHFNQHGRMH